MQFQPDLRAGHEQRSVDLVNRYMGRVLLAARVSPEVNTAMILVQNLIAPPSTLFKPKMIRTVLRAARTAGVVTTPAAARQQVRRAA